MHLYLIMFFPSGSQSSWEEQTRKDGHAEIREAADVAERPMSLEAQRHD